MSHAKVILFRHVLIWILFICYELALIKITVGIISSPFQFVIYYALNIALFYANAHLILDFAFFKTSRPYLISILLIIVELGIFLFIKLHVDAWLSGKNAVIYKLDTLHERLYLTNIFREIFFVGFSIAYWSMLYLVKFKQRNHLMEKENLKQMAHSLELENKYITAENAYLQNQISPHLLFNTLNFIYNTIHNLSEKAGRGVMLLAEMMHYSLLSNQDNRKVTVLEEVKQIDKLIELSALRFNNELYIRFIKKGKLKEVSIPPLILVTLVENMLKHGDLGEQSHPGRISLEITGDQLIFVTHNLKRKSSPHPPSGLGLYNIQKRLGNLYPNKHRFSTNEDENIYHTELTLNL